MNIDGEDDDLNGTAILDPEDSDKPPQDGQHKTDGQNEAEQQDEHEVYAFGDEAEPADDEPEHIRDLRQRYRDEKRRREELEARFAPKPVDIGPEPTLDDDDVQWDEAKFKSKLAAWHERKSKADEQGRSQREREEAAKREYQAEVDALAEQGRSIKAPNYEAIRDRALGDLTEVQQSLLIQATTNKAGMLYALGSNPAKLAELKAITNPVKFVAAAARLETQMKTGKRPTTQPERKHGGGGSLAATGRKYEERIQAEASTTGDRSKVLAERLKARATTR